MYFIGRDIQLFNKISQLVTWQDNSHTSILFLVRVSFIEIYREVAARAREREKERTLCIHVQVEKDGSFKIFDPRSVGFFPNIIRLL